MTWAFPSPEERFWAKVDRRSDSECWEWTGIKDHGGYGRLRVGNLQPATHRFSWELANGPPPPGLCVCHRCDNPACVNPAHLFLGTHHENMLDMARKGRNHRSRNKGESSPVAKLGEADVLSILSSGERTRVLASRFGVSINTITRIRRGESWKHLQGKAA